MRLGNRLEYGLMEGQLLLVQRGVGSNPTIPTVEDRCVSKEVKGLMQLREDICGRMGV